MINLRIPKDKNLNHLHSSAVSSLSQILDPYNLSSEEHYQPKPTSIENVTKNNKSGQLGAGRGVNFVF